jgi:hypothetical protein
MIRLLLLPLAYLAHKAGMFARVPICELLGSHTYTWHDQHLRCEHCAALHYWPPQ